jgi:hypothetical protein
VPAANLFEEILDAPDRDRCPGARPCISWKEDDEPEFLAQVKELARARIQLSRRGVDHGGVAVLDLYEPDVDTIEARWAEARPIVLHGCVAPGLPHAEVELAENLRRPGGLLSLAARGAPFFRPLREVEEVDDAERDLSKVLVGCEDEEVDDLWLKVSRLSTHPADESLRLRVSHGAEIRDDASPDRLRNTLASLLAQAVLPGTELVHEDSRLPELLERMTDGPVLLTQHIGYWNAPEGGALFHHDAFDEPWSDRQLGVLYAQLHGRTLWLALPIEELAGRLFELAEWLETELPVPPDEVLHELATPGCGRLAWMVNRPELTGLLADAGHAFLLEPGDAILLPNHGYERTCMHSVFCASPEVTFGLSMALRRG